MCVSVLLLEQLHQEDRDFRATRRHSEPGSDLHQVLPGVRSILLRVLVTAPVACPHAPIYGNYGRPCCTPDPLHGLDEWLSSVPGLPSPRRPTTRHVMTVARASVVTCSFLLFCTAAAPLLHLCLRDLPLLPRECSTAAPRHARLRCHVVLRILAIL